MRKLLIIWVASCFALLALVNVTTTADVTGDGAAHQIGVTGTATWVQFIALPSNTASGAVRIGDANVSASRGAAIAPGAGFMLPPIAAEPRQSAEDRLYDLSKLYYFAASGDKLSIVWGR